MKRLLSFLKGREWMETFHTAVKRLIMVLHFYSTVLDLFTEYFGLYVVPFLRLGLGLGLGFMFANKKQKYDGDIHLQ
jgi:hypothetical protein